MTRRRGLAILAAADLLAVASGACAQANPYIGFVYPAGGQRGTVFQVRLGGQRLTDVRGAIVSGPGVEARLVEYRRSLSNQDLAFLKEQLQELKKQEEPDQAAVDLMARIQARIDGHVSRPANASLSNIAIVEVSIAADAAPCAREIRLVTRRSVSNPLVFHVGQAPEVTRKAMGTSPLQVLGKEHLARRKRPAEEEEARIEVPCTMNGQIASGEVNRYRFAARKGQRLVISVQARQLIPYIADAVPGWFQPVLTLFDARGNEVAYNDDYRFRPDPLLLVEVPEDGDYVLAITDALYRGREDFVYRITVGATPFVTSIFPLGGRSGEDTRVEMKGWNLERAELKVPSGDADPGVYFISAERKDDLSNRVPFALNTLPECFEKEPNNDPEYAQKLTLPVIVNGRMDAPDDVDVFQFEGRSGDVVVSEIQAKRLDSPLDSILKLTDAADHLLAFNDDHRDPESGLNTHHADSYLMVELPADGVYRVHVGDIGRNGGEAYGYRLRISAPQPDFALRVVPSSLSIRGKGRGTVTVYAVRKDGYDGPIRLRLRDAPGFSCSPVSLSKTQEMARLTIKTDLSDTPEPTCLTIEGRARIQERDAVRGAVAAEDYMQAFLWRHLVPVNDLRVVVFDPARKPRPERVPPAPPPLKEGDAETSGGEPRFTAKQVAGLIRQLDRLYEEGFITDAFYLGRRAEYAVSP